MYLKMLNAPTRKPALFPGARAAFLSALASCLAIAPLPVVAQATKTASTPPPEFSHVDLYGGYGYFDPNNSAIGPFAYQSINPGVVASVTAYFNRYLGVQAEGALFPCSVSDCVYTVQAGPVFRYQKNRFIPFAHVLAGGAKVCGPAFQPCTWGWGVTAGLGVDYILPVLNNRLALRPIQADFHYSHVDYGPIDPAQVTGGIGDIKAYQLSTGVVLRFSRLTPPPAVQLDCSVEPANVYPGDPVTVTADVANLNLKKKAKFTWTTSGGKLTSSGDTATIATAGLPIGDYTVSGHIFAGLRPGQKASCTAGFRVHAEPPTITCSANPSSVLPGGTSTITSTASSAQNRTLSYSYSSTGGQIAGTSPTAALNTSGAPSGTTITITCNAVDDLGQQSSATTAITIATPPPPLAPSVRKLCSISFERDRKRPVRVDNEAKGCLDEITLFLNRDTTSKLVIVGRHSADESSDSAAQRDLNVEDYFTKEKGIDASRIQLRTSGEPGRALDSTLVPAGALFIPGDTTTFDSNSVKREGQPYAKP